MKIFAVCFILLLGSFSFASQQTLKFSGALHFKSDGSRTPASLVLTLKKETQNEAIYAGAAVVQMDRGPIRMTGDFKVKKQTGRVTGKISHRADSFLFSGNVLASGLSNLSFRQYALTNNCEAVPGSDGIPDISCSLDHLQTDSGIFN